MATHTIATTTAPTTAPRLTIERHAAHFADRITGTNALVLM
ncbi:hypothetical protein RB614_41295 [Phytohabitans sp. ZYX-F-186]|uniref:Uncharacterized protein n=1 Tax=Phytohabitans maris TaxID=3071409 RepID=A0ABU0ZXA5_9ACTN|nr:hypothetical protein [Phytohabitans sp. ZYX-F-186]MDQ7910944.1 hypothetical protein [Phytohabitans sp. ZYX-F-186]